MYAQVILSRISSFLDKPFVYEVPKELEESAKIGSQVAVPFGRTKAVGYIVEMLEKPPEQIKNIKKLIEVRSSDPLFSEESVEIAAWLSRYYVSFFGSALRMVLPPGISEFEKPRGKKRVKTEVSTENTDPVKQIDPKLPEISIPAKNILARIEEDIKTKKFSQDLIFQRSYDKDLKVLYLHIARSLISSGKGIIILFPDIEYLSPAAELFTKYFGGETAVIHSSMPEKERLAQWLKVYSGESRIVLGTRTAVFAPVRDLGAIIIDREEGFAYKQETSPKYNCRQAACFIAGKKNIPVILSSSCPDIESFHDSRACGDKVFFLSEDGFDKKAGAAEVVDMNSQDKTGGIFSKELFSAISQTLKNKGKVLLIVNRKGFSTYLICADCGNHIECPNCSVPVTYSVQEKSISCRLCGFSKGTSSLVCPNCLGHRIKYMGSGTQKIESELARFFQGIKTLRIDRDSIKKGAIYDVVYELFSKGDADVLIGTQLAAKALDLCDVDLVGVLSVDNALGRADFRSAEETFRLIYNICGHKNAKRVIVQTYKPEHYAIKYAASLDYEGFYDREIEQRKESGDPPFGQMISILVSGKDKDHTMGVVNDMTKPLERYDGIKVFGPVQASHAKVRGMNRWQILIKGPCLDMIKADLIGVVHALKDRQIKISIDVDPISVM